MTKTFEKIINKIKKIRTLYILKESEDYVIVGAKKIIKEHQELIGNPFQPWSQNIDKEFPVFFMIITDKTKPAKFKEFEMNKFPIIIFDDKPKSKDYDDLEIILDKYIKSF